MSAKKPPVVLPRSKRKFLTLTCSKCSTKVVIQGYEDPDDGDGWPMHRCGWDARPFDQSAPAPGGAMIGRKGV